MRRASPDHPPLRFRIQLQQSMLRDESGHIAQRHLKYVESRLRPLRHAHRHYVTVDKAFAVLLFGQVYPKFFVRIFLQRLFN